MSYNEVYLLPTFRSREGPQADRQMKVTVENREAGSWSRGQLGNPEGKERQPLEAATKQRNEDRDWEH
jgi:hypothetical protein